jgi:hypothetical protein
MSTETTAAIQEPQEMPYHPPNLSGLVNSVMDYDDKHARIFSCTSAQLENCIANYGPNGIPDAIHRGDIPCRRETHEPDETYKKSRTIYTAL